MRIFYRHGSKCMERPGVIFLGNPRMVVWNLAVGWILFLSNLVWNLFFLYRHDPECMEFGRVIFYVHSRMVDGNLAVRIRLFLVYLDGHDEQSGSDCHY